MSSLTLSPMSRPPEAKRSPSARKLYPGEDSFPRLTTQPTAISCKWAPRPSERDRASRGDSHPSSLV